VRLTVVPTAALLAALVAAAPAHAAVAPAPTAVSTSSQAADLRARVDRALLGSTAGAVSVSVDVDGIGEVVRRSAGSSLPPASTEKLYTTATALRLLGSDARSRTQLRTPGTQYGGLLRGDLYLVASGDPYLTSAQLDNLARLLARTGIRTISGHLVVDDTRYDRVRRGDGWKAAWVPEESGPLSALALDRNAWRTDSAYLADPATPALSKLRGYLARQGVRFTTTDLRRGAAPSWARPLASHVSAPLSTTVRQVLKDSDNFAAELLLKEVGRVGRGSGTAAAGAAEVREVLQGAGAAVGTVTDGSGLSPRNRQTTAGELTLLVATERAPSYSTLRAALPVACRDGTLKKRFCGTVAEARVFAKTGTLDTVRALTGWTYTRDGHLVRFSFLLSGFSSGLKSQQAIDRAVVVLAGCTVGPA
jgi:D-alanyl-D-alanine carboxypeptidase